MKILDKTLYFLYFMSSIFCIYDIIIAKDISRMATLIWVINALVNFSLYRQTDKMLDRQIEWRDKLIEELFKERINEKLKYFKEK